MISILKKKITYKQNLHFFFSSSNICFDTLTCTLEPDSHLNALMYIQCHFCMVFQEKKRHIIGYFGDVNSDAYRLFAKVASTLREECEFHSAVGYGWFF